MERTTGSSASGAAVAALAAVALLGAAPAAASGTTAAQAGPCPSTVDVGGETAYLTAFVCGTATVNVGTPWPVSIGVTVGHCTGCECGYVMDGPAGSQFTRRGAAECGLGGAPSGGGAGGGDGDDLGSDDGCQWGRDYIGWEPDGC